MSATRRGGPVAPARWARIAGARDLAMIAGGVFAALFVGDLSLALWLAVKGVRVSEPEVA